MTLPQMIRDRHNRWKDRRCFLVKRSGAYQPVLWADFYRQAQEVALALLARGFAPGDRAAILGPTRPEWAVADVGILTAGGITVPIYPSLSAGEVKDLVVRSGATVLFAADAEQVAKALPILDEVAALAAVVVFDPEALAGVSHPRALTLAALRAEAASRDVGELEARLAARSPDDVATVLFTSGTTGEPKGVALTHRNLLANIEASVASFTIGPDDVALAHLPLAHILERMAGYYLMLYCGATIAYAEDIKTVAANLAEVRPTLAVSVPRIFEKVFAGIQAKAAEAPGLVRRLTFWAIGVANRVGAQLDRGQPLPLGLALQRALADRLVFGKIRAKLGGRLRFFISGGAPLAPELALFFSGVGVKIYEGYGLTETSPVLAVNTPAHHRAGTVGKPLPNVELRLGEDGEIQARGPSVFGGYYRNEAATREAFTADGFFCTGDIGEFTADGFLRITDRKKDLIVTAAGKNVAPQKVENVLKLSKYIAEVMLFGDKKQFISAVVVPDFEWLRRYAELKGLGALDTPALVAHPQVQDYYQRLIRETQAKAGLGSFESVRRFVLLDHEFSLDQGEVTPTLKIRRQQITARYRAELEALYAGGGADG